MENDGILLRKNELDRTYFMNDDSDHLYGAAVYVAMVPSLGFGVVLFSNHGICMYPCMWPKDVVKKL